MNGDLERRRLLAGIVARLPAASLDELLGLDQHLATYEAIREGADGRRWERRLPTGPSDFDRSFHMAIGKPSRGIVDTLCNGSWPFDDLAEHQHNPAFAERCRACWLAAVAGNWLAFGHVVLADQLEDEERRRAAKRELARRELDQVGNAEAIAEYGQREAARRGAAPLSLTADLTLRAQGGDELRCDALATPDGKPVKVTDGGGREIGTAVVVDGRIQATITDPATAQRLRHDHSAISMGYRVVVEPEPATPRESRREPATGPIVAAAEFAAAQHATRIGGPEPYESIEIDVGEFGEGAR